MCYGLGCEYENRYTGECSYRGWGYPCTAWPDDESDEREDDSCQDEGEEE